jgi:hypothetical protein
MPHRKHDRRIREQPLDDRERVHRERVLVDQELAVCERHILRRNSEIFVARFADLLVARIRKVFEG